MYVYCEQYWIQCFFDQNDFCVTHQHCVNVIATTIFIDKQCSETTSSMGGKLGNQITNSCQRFLFLQRSPEAAMLGLAPEETIVFCLF